MGFDNSIRAQSNRVLIKILCKINCPSRGVKLRNQSLRAGEIG